MRAENWFPWKCGTFFLYCFLCLLPKKVRGPKHPSWDSTGCVLFFFFFFFFFLLLVVVACCCLLLLVVMTFAFCKKRFSHVWIFSATIFIRFAILHPFVFKLLVTGVETVKPFFYTHSTPVSGSYLFSLIIPSLSLFLSLGPVPEPPHCFPRFFIVFVPVDESQPATDPFPKFC